jgi:hypothetical protein
MLSRREKKRGNNEERVQDMILEITHEKGDRECINMSHVQNVTYDKDAENITFFTSTVTIDYGTESADATRRAYELIRKKWLLNGYVQIDWTGKMNAWEV